MAKKRPYEDLLDKELINTWRKRDNEYTDYYMIPRLNGEIVDFKKSQTFAEKIDRLEEELLFRKLFGLNGLRLPTQKFYEIENNKENS